MLRLAEAQQLYDAVNDPLCRAGLAAFFKEQTGEHVKLLLSAIARNKERNFYKESELKGKIDAYETSFPELERYAQRQLETAAGNSQ